LASGEGSAALQEEMGPCREGFPSADGVGMLAQEIKTSWSEYEGAFEWPVIDWCERMYGVGKGMLTSLYFCRTLFNCSMLLRPQRA